MSLLAQEVEAALSKLDPSTAAKFERLVRDVVSFVQSPPRSDAPTPSLYTAYFDSVIGAFANIEFDRPPQGTLPVVKRI